MSERYLIWIALGLHTGDVIYFIAIPDGRPASERLLSNIAVKLSTVILLLAAIGLRLTRSKR